MSNVLVASSQNHARSFSRANGSGGPREPCTPGVACGTLFLSASRDSGGATNESKSWHRSFRTVLTIMKQFTHLAIVCTVWFLGLCSVLADDASAGAPAVDYQRDVQPILAERCFHCHGRDAATREGGLRLDLRESALEGGDSGSPAIVPDKPEESELIRRVTCDDEDEAMPPAEEDKRLSDAQVEIFKKWISAGAHYSVHWAFVPPQKILLPPSGSSHPVDALVAARLLSLQLQPAPPESPHKLCRRLYLDLIGLPPSPQELEAFEREWHRSHHRITAAKRAIWRKVGSALARCRSLFRHQRLRKGPAARAVGLARLGDQRIESGHALRPVHYRTGGRRSAPQRHARSRSSPPAFCATACSTKKVPSSRNNFAWSKCSIAWIVWAKRCSA